MADLVGGSSRLHEIRGLRGVRCGRPLPKIAAGPRRAWARALGPESAGQELEKLMHEIEAHEVF